ncbi:collagen alpha-1(III) chain-like [Oxyura jamaicensis]|uniref:collagen alpha-1(III) chain-like n=1 Tax=Oxyura jamaicensis TaxID=8884 RepID=UPI0015A61544|nr:collagen alpha-1(III) chain-like [Oxyura jamaicensis]
MACACSGLRVDKPRSGFHAHEAAEPSGGGDPVVPGLPACDGDEAAHGHVSVAWCPASTPGLVQGVLPPRRWWRWGRHPARAGAVGEAQVCGVQRKRRPQRRRERGWPETAGDRPGHQQEHTARMEPAKPPPSKRMAPAPPVPAKTKPTLGLPSKPGGPQPSTSAEMERGRAGDPDPDGFSTLQVTTAKLSHPTATRPRVPGRRPPSMAGGGLGPPCAELCPHLPAAGQGPEQRLALEDLKAEVRSLHILVDLMRGQHLRDLEDVRLELQHERARREALQSHSGQ